MTTSTQLESWGRINVPFWGGVFSSDTLPARPPKRFRCVVNFDPSDHPGSHWLGIVLHGNGTGEFFDSYGVKADGDGAFLHSRFHTHFSNYMDKQCPMGWGFNNWDLQSMHTRTCGQYALWFCHANGGPVTAPTFWQWASMDLDANDAKIKENVKLYFQFECFCNVNVTI